MAGQGEDMASQGEDRGEDVANNGEPVSLRGDGPTFDGLDGRLLTFIPLCRRWKVALDIHYTIDDPMVEA